MAIIVQHLTTGNEYIFLGVSGGESKNILPTKMLGDFFATETPDKSRSLTVCDDQGRILWFPVTEMIVVEVDGQKPEELLPEIIPPEPVPLQLDPIRADSLIFLQSEQLILHTEFQTDPNSKIPQQF